MRKIGERICAIRNADDETAYIYGFGTYAGDEVPPEDVGGIARLGLFGIKNPKLVRRLKEFFTRKERS